MVWAFHFHELTYYCTCPTAEPYYTVSSRSLFDHLCWTLGYHCDWWHCHEGSRHLLAFLRLICLTGPSSLDHYHSIQTCEGHCSTELADSGPNLQPFIPVKTLVDPVPEMHGKVILRWRKMRNLKVGVGKKSNKDHLQQTAQIAETAGYSAFHLLPLECRGPDVTLTLVIMIHDHHDQLLI